jgi:hypothetical protein
MMLGVFIIIIFWYILPSKYVYIIEINLPHIILLPFLNLLIPTVHVYLKQLFSKSDIRKESFGFFMY